MASRSQRAKTAAETLAISQGGVYLAPSGNEVQIGDWVEEAIHTTRLYTPNDVRSLSTRAQRLLPERNFDTTIEVRNETTLAAGKRLVDHYGSERVAALNFASAKNPGGGFLGGSQAQEESLARSTALYVTLLTQQTYYDANRHGDSCLYTDHLIYSPRVPIFRDDADTLLEEPWQMSFITSPAPNAGAIAKNEPERLDYISATLCRRMEQVLSVAVVEGQTALVLGAWGCGVFRNDPADVAALFASFLLGDGAYSKAFEAVAFAVYDREGSSLAAFESTFPTRRSSL